jgi:hypothetical protein
MCPVERLRVSACRPDFVIGLSLSLVSNYTHRKNGDDTLLTIRFDRCAMLDMMFAGDYDAYQRR